MATRRALLVALTGAAASPALPVFAQPAPQATVLAASSLTDVLQQVAQQAGLAGRIRFSFAASSTLARQIEQGAPADVFISADEAWMDYAQKRGLIDAATRRVMAGNRLALIEPGTPGPTEPPQTADAVRAALARMLKPADARIAVGDPSNVPVGEYAQQALTTLGLWAQVEPRLARAENVRAGLALVERGEAAGGIVYRSDAALSKKVRVVALFPASSHRPVHYAAALLPQANATARQFFAALFTLQAAAALRAAGFEPAP